MVPLSLQFDFSHPSPNISLSLPQASAGRQPSLVDDGKATGPSTEFEMSLGSRTLALLSSLLLFTCIAMGQQPAAAQPSSVTAAPAQQPQSLGDWARKMRKDKPMDVKMTDVDAKELFS